MRVPHRVQGMRGPKVIISYSSYRVLPCYKVWYVLGCRVGPFCPFSFWVPLIKPNSRKRGTLISKRPPGNQAYEGFWSLWVQGLRFEREGS